MTPSIDRIPTVGNDRQETGSRVLADEQPAGSSPLWGYVVCVASTAVSAFVAFTPAGNRLVPRPWAWVSSVLLLLSVLVGLLLVLVMLFSARRRGQRMLPRAALLLPLLGAVATCTLAPLPVFTVDVDGFDRRYRVYAPADYDGTRPYPLILVLHGFMQDWKSIRTLSRFDALAEREQALVVYPDGYRRSWNDGDDGKPATKAGLDDAGFVRRIIEQVSETHNVAGRRVYAVGFSNSGFLLVRHACALADRVAAIGVVAAGVYPLWEGPCPGRDRMPAMFIVGSADPMLATLTRHEIEPSRSGELWSRANGCSEHVVRSIPDGVDDGTRSRRDEYRGCTDDASVVLVRVEGGGHTWPGGPQYLPAALIGSTSRDFDATEQLWRFFVDVGGNATRAPHGP